jgi:hypothetical protein
MREVMPLSSNFTARVPLVSGKMIEKIAKNMSGDL